MGPKVSEKFLVNSSLLVCKEEIAIFSQNEIHVELVKELEPKIMWTLV